MTPLTETPLGLAIEIGWLLIFVDCFIAGFRAARSDVVPSTPKLAGYLFLRLAQVGRSNYKGTSRFYRALLTPRAMGINLMLVGGILGIRAIATLVQRLQVVR